ncbi:MAG: HTH domain-containing protein [Methylococcaceae bacterium]|nr:HTH domain-containing protein [Methylococcaceae bacterium]
MQNQPTPRQEQILALLLATKTGLCIDEIAEQQEISRNAVKQHMITLEKNLLIKTAHLKFTKGRPARNYILTEQGINHFSKQYSWFCNLVLSELKEEMGADGFADFMKRLGRKIAHSLASQFTGKNAKQKAEILTTIMQNLGYQVTIEKTENSATITAINCVFHDLAQEHSELCEFDRELIGTLLDNPIEQTECMAKKGCACRFKTEF